MTTQPPTPEGSGLDHARDLAAAFEVAELAGAVIDACGPVAP